MRGKKAKIDKDRYVGRWVGYSGLQAKTTALLSPTGLVTQTLCVRRAVGGWLGAASL